MSLVGFAGLLEHGEKSMVTNRVGTVEHPLFQLYLVASRHLFNFAFHVVTEILGHVGQSVATVVQGCPVVCVNRLEDGYALFWRM